MEKTATLEQAAVRGFQFQVLANFDFGLGESTQLIPFSYLADGQKRITTRYYANQTLEIKQTNSLPASNNSKSTPTPLLSEPPTLPHLR